MTVEGHGGRRQPRDFGALCTPAPAKRSYIDFGRLHLYWQGEYFYYLFYYLLYELSLFTWRFCLLLQVWNYLLLLGICALFKKRALFFFFIMDNMLR